MSKMSLNEIATKAIRLAWRNTCIHEETHRGGILWTICNHCGMKWADDEGGFQPSETAKEIEALEDELAEHQLEAEVLNEEPDDYEQLCNHLMCELPQDLVSETKDIDELVSAAAHDIKKLRRKVKRAPAKDAALREALDFLTGGGTTKERERIAALIAAVLPKKAKARKP